MATKTPPGDGKNNPFVGGGSPGSGKGGKFDLQAGHGPTAPGKAPPFDQFAQANPQGGYSDVELAQEVPGGRILKADPGSAPSATDVGTRTQGQAKSGFRLNG